jgi:hypothetical protein
MGEVYVWDTIILACQVYFVSSTGTHASDADMQLLCTFVGVAAGDDTNDFTEHAHP